MSRAKVSLDDVKNVSKAVSVAESTATSTVMQIESSVKNNISTLESAYQQVETVLNTCNRSLTQLQRMRMEAEKRLSALKKELCNTPPKIEKTVIGEDGEPKTVKEDNPRYIELQREISAVTQKISEYNSLIRNFNALASDCAKQKEVISAAKYSLCSICDELKATRDNYTTKCETAIKRLSDISAMIDAYMAVRIYGGSSSGVGVSYSAPVAKSGGFGAFVKKTVAIGSMASAIVSPVTAVSSNGMNGLAEQQQEAYHNLDLKEKKRAAEKESELAINENNTPKVLSPTQTDENLSVTVTQDGKNIDYIISVDSDNPNEKSPLIVDMSTEAKANEKLSSEIAGEPSDSKDDSSKPLNSNKFVNKNSEGVSKEVAEENEQKQKKDDHSNKSRPFWKTAGLMFGVTVASLSNQGASTILNVENTNNVVSMQSASTNDSFIEYLTIESEQYKVYLAGEDSSGIISEIHSEEDLPKEDAPTMAEAVQKLADLATDILEEGFDPINVKNDKERRKESEESKRKQEEQKKKKQLLIQEKERKTQQEEKRNFSAKQAIKSNNKK